jgi:YD repeat-containing protein
LNGVRTIYNYDGFCRPSAIISAKGAVESTSYTFDAQGFLQIRTDAKERSTSPVSAITQFYDGLGRPIRRTTQADDRVITEDRVYNNAGNIVRASLPYYADASPFWETYTYDALGNRLTATHADGSQAQWKPVANGLLTTDERGAQRRIRTDGHQHPIEVQEKIDGQWKGLSHAYDPLGRVIAMAILGVMRTIRWVDNIAWTIPIWERGNSLTMPLGNLFSKQMPRIKRRVFLTMPLADYVARKRFAEHLRRKRLSGTTMKHALVFSTLARKHPKAMTLSAQLLTMT